MDIKNALRTIKKSKKLMIPNQLVTEWGEAILEDSSSVWMEYPRPQLVRRSYVNLNGWWNYAFTSSQVRPVEYDGEILVPFSPESYLSGVGRTLLPYECLWYVKKVTLDEIPENERCILNFGAVDQIARVYVNHCLVGEHIGGYLPFSFEVTNYLVAGDNEICIMVKDSTDTSWHSRGKQKMDHGGMFYTPQSGIWQTVWLEWVPKVYLEKLKVTPLFDSNKVRIEMRFSQKGIAKQIEIVEGKEVIAKAVTKRDAVELEIHVPREWSPEQPFLYGIAIKSGEDFVKSYFAMRKVSVGKDSNGISRILLNNKPYFMNGLLDQGYWPDGLMTAPSDQALIADITEMKKLGFNTLRKHCKIEQARWYYHCDRLGMLVWQDMVNGGEAYQMGLVTYLPTVFTQMHRLVKDCFYEITSRKNEDGRRQWIKECRETVKWLRNFPSIVVWVPFNEGWGQFDSKRVYQIIRKLDKTRLIDHASGWFDQGCGDLKSVHNYFRKLTVKPEKRPFVLSEYGGYSCHIKNHSYSDQVYGYRKYGKTEELNHAIKELEKERQQLIKQGLAAAIYTQVSDVEEEVNGILTYDRKINKWEDL